MFSNFFIRNIDFGGLLEDFLVAAVAAILVTRLYLILANYPQVGGGGLHIAHMLWGGLLMLASIILLLSFLSRAMVRLSSIIAGIGFGLFIDELGKFITSDNNYFFQPTFSLIYIIFILLYLLFEAIGKKQFSEREYLANSLDVLKEAIINDLNLDEKKQALIYLTKANPRLKITQILEHTFKSLQWDPLESTCRHASLSIL